MSLLRRALLKFSLLPRRYHGMIIGAVFWLFWMLFGFWRTLLLLVLAGIGYVVGRILEENQSWRDLLDKLLAERFTE
ncbi:DUF2273 domain-containing protein [Alicyclobacillus dauci]|uniref:DUF2273 domain-containing protein n=1 Tax=Alicyclobacillus dauci TaxID=1475485 RepID=A0ABY6Z9S2_9BACL|nr:DUF2273 domain-containing protein [Alicyclobacillus dauci]WAH39006.1 DUF2273 domain-containing protein [Alicyclobacillus dauci]